MLNKFEHTKVPELTNELESKVINFLNNAAAINSVQDLYETYRNLKRDGFISELEEKKIFELCRKLNFNSREYLHSFLADHKNQQRIQCDAVKATILLLILIFLVTGDLRIWNSLYKNLSSKDSFLVAHCQVHDYIKLMDSILSQIVKIENAK